jgi:hypothetical protein
MKIIIVFLLLFVSKISYSQTDIIYRFEKNISDTLYKVVKFYKNANNESQPYVIMDLDSSGMTMYVQDYKNYPATSGLVSLIMKSNRKINLNGKIIPVIFPIDILSDDVKKDRISYLPLRGYYIKINKVDNVSVITSGITL